MSLRRTMDSYAAPRGAFLLAFTAVYLVWGSTYLAIRIALDSIPPFLLMGLRSLLAGGLLYAWGRLREGARPGPGHWRSSLLVGALFFLVGHGGLAWAETRVASGTAALIIATEPIWVVLFAGKEGGRRPRVLFAMLLGMAGMALLSGPASVLGAGAVDLLGAAVLCLASLSWALGSVLSRRIARPESTALTTGMDLLAGGALLCLGSILRGEPAALGPVSPGAVAALLYLVGFGSIVALTAYNWLLRNTTLPRASSYVYVNPVVAVLIGALLGGEALTPRVGAAAALLIFSVVLIMAPPPAPEKAPRPHELEPAACRT